ncbi:ESPR-type extended signal peptide-containing protein, partial [Burkholderia cenocepacia]
MNKSYRTVWNATTGTWAAAPETARMRTKSKSNATMKSSVTAAVAVMAGVGGVTMAADANAQASNGNGSLVLCSPTGSSRPGTAFGGGNSSGTGLTGGCGANPIFNNRSTSFMLYNNATANGTSTGARGSAATEAGIQGSTDGHLTLLGGSGVHIMGPADFNNNVNMTNHQVKNLAAATAGTDAVNLNQLNQAISKVSGFDDTYIKVRGSGAAATAGAAISVAIGVNAVTGADANATAVGANSNAQGLSSTAIGSSASSNGRGASSFGRLAVADGTSATALGNEANAGVANAVAVGDRATVGAGATSSVAIGSQASVGSNVTNAVAIGAGSNATRSNTLSVGSATQQRQIVNVAAGTQGTDAVNLNQLNTAIAGVKTSDNPYVRINSTGAAAVAGGGNAVAVGQNSNALAVQSIAMGNNALTSATSTAAVALGSNASATGDWSVALGGATGSGRGAVATGSHSVALGTLSQAIATDSVALGVGSVADRGNTVSVGASVPNGDGRVFTRQIVNVGAGTQATDAVNVSQLKGVTDALGGGAAVGSNGDIKNPTYNVGGTDYHNVGDALDALAASGIGNPNAVIYDDVTKGAVTLGGTGATVPVALKNVADAKDDHDALNLGQLKNAGLVGDDGSGNLTSLAVTYDGAAKDTVTLAGADGTTLSNVKAGVADMDAVNVSQLKGSGLIGDDGKSIAAVTYDRNVDGTPNYGTVTLGNGNGPTQIKNVADATDDHDALNLGQLKDAGLVGDDGAGKLTSLAVTYDDASKDKVTLAGTDGTTLSNVKAGVADRDAVNVSQLKDSGLIGDDGKAIAAVTYDSASKDKVTLAGADGTTLSNVKAGVADMDAVNVSQLKDSGLIGDDGKAIAAVTYDSAAKDSVTLGGVGSTTPVALHNVADGVLSATSKDAVNGSQLFATNENLGKLKDSLEQGGVIDPVTGESLAVVYDSNAKDTVTLKGADGTTLSNVKAGAADMDAVNVSQLKGSGLIGDDGKSIAAVTYDRNADGTPNYGTVTLGHGEGPTQIKNVATGVDDTDAVNVKQLTSGLSDLKDEMSRVDLRFVKVNADPVTGTPAVASGALAVAIGSDARATSANSLALGSGARVTGTGSVAIGYNSVANQNNVVSVGDVGRERKIVNVADGDVAFQSTDAVNGGQLYAALNNLSTSVTSKTQQAIDTFSSEIDKKTQAAIDEVNSRSMQPMDVSDPLVAIEGLKGNNVASLNGADPTQATAAAIGSSTAASGANAVAVGLQSGAGSDNSVAIGSFAQTGAGQDYSVAVGSNVQTNGTQAVALGANAQANGNYALAVGNNGAQAIGDGSIAMGNAANVRAGSTNAIAIGTGANVARSVEGAMAFGANATAGAANSIALGANAFSDRANALSIGRAGAERQIVNVAAGTQATDAVNVSQLKGVTDSLGGGTTIGADGSITKPTYKVDGSDYHNVGDALDALASRSAGDPNAVAYDSAAKDTVTLGGAGATTPVALKNVADAKDDHDALNLGQLKDAGLVGQDGSGNLTSLAVTYDGTSKDKVTLAGADGTTLSNVKAGVADMDAVNVSQLKGSGLIGDDGKSIAAVTYDKNADGTPNYGS